MALGNTSCHALSTAFDIPKRTPLISDPSPSGLYISRIIANNWLTQESLGLKPDWLEKNNLLSVKKVNSPL